MSYVFITLKKKKEAGYILCKVSGDFNLGDFSGYCLTNTASTRRFSILITERHLFSEASLSSEYWTYKIYETVDDLLKENFAELI